eukprot:EG_transcript_19286
MAAPEGMTHTPYHLAPAPEPTPRAQAQAPTIQRSPCSHTMAVLQEIQRGGAETGGIQFGWRVMRKLWNVTPADFDNAALLSFSKQPVHIQLHVLLTLATNDLRKVKNLSAFLSYLLHEQEVGTSVCLALLAGCCHKGDRCTFLHPTVAPGWQKLQERWHVGWLDFDYLVLNSLLQKPADRQDDILWRLGSMRLKAVRNLSAVLASVIAQCEKRPPPAGKTPRSQRSSLSSTVQVISEAETLGHSDAGCGASDAGSHDSPAASTAGTSDGSPRSWADELEAEVEAGLWPDVALLPCAISTKPSPPPTAAAARPAAAAVRPPPAGRPRTP